MVKVEVGLSVEDVREQKPDHLDEVLAQFSRAKIASVLLARAQLHELSMKNSPLTTACMAENTKQYEV